MIRFLYALLLLLSLAPAAPAQIAGEGRSFVLMLPYTEVARRGESPHVRLLLTSLRGADVHIVQTSTGSSQSVTVPPEGAAEVMLDSAAVMLPQMEGVFRNSIRITATEPVTAILMVDRAFTSESYAAIPDSLLDFNYVVPGTDASLVGATMAVYAVEDRTTISIRPAVATRGGHAAGVRYSVVLDRGEVYQLLTDRFTDTDLSGTTVESDRPCGVLSGSICAEIPIPGEHSCNPLVEQIPGSHAGASEFIVGPLPRQESAYYRIMSVCGEATVRIDGVEAARLKQGETYDFSSMLPVHVTATDSISMMQLIVSTSRGLQDRLEAYGDPSWMTVTPVREWSARFLVVSPQLEPRDDGDGYVEWRHYAQIVLPASAEAGLRIDGGPPVWNTRFARDNYIVGSVVLRPLEAHGITASEPVSVQMLGYSRADAYGHNPAPTRRQLPLRLGEYHWTACGDTLDTAFVIINPLERDLEFSSIAPFGEFDCTILEPAGPFTIPVHDSVRVRVSIRGIRNGIRDGYLRLATESCPGIGGVVELHVEYSGLQLTPDVGSTIDFGTLLPGRPYTEQRVTITNPGTVPVEILSPDLSPARFVIVTPAFPYVLAPGASVDVILRFMTGEIGAFEGTISFRSSDCPNPQVLLLRAIQSGSSLSPTPAPDPIRLLCAPKEEQEIEIRISNLGGAEDRIVHADIVGAAAAEFTILTPLAGTIIAPGGAAVMRVRYTPGPLGPRPAVLRVMSGPGGGDTMLMLFDIRNDTMRLEPLEDMLDFGVSNLCASSPVLQVHYVNRGTAPVTGINAGLRLDGLARISLSRTTVDPGDTAVLTVSVDPSVSGTFNGGVRLRLPYCGYDAFVAARGMRGSAILAYSTDTLDFGLVPVCAAARELLLTLENLGSVADSLDPVYLPSAADFDVSLPGDPVRIDASGVAQIVVGFHPSAPGIFDDSIILRSRSCGTLRTIVLRGVLDEGGVTADVQDIDFGPVDLGSSATGLVRISNSSSFPRTLSPAMLEGSLVGLRVVRPAQETVIPSGGSIDIELEYVPVLAPDTLAGRIMLLVSDPCDDTILVNVQGRAEGEERLAELRWERIEGNTGEATAARLFLEQGNARIEGADLILRTSLRFDASMLLPLGIDGISPAVSAQILGDAVQGSDRVLTIEARGDLPRSGPVLQLRLLPMLGAAETTPLAFDGVDLRWAVNDLPITITDTTDGMFTLLDVCHAGGGRLVGTPGLLRIAPVRPDPVRDGAAIEFETVEDGWSRLSIVDARGRVVAVPYEGSAPAGVRSAVIDGARLPGGAFWLVLETPTSVLRRRMMVVR